MGDEFNNLNNEMFDYNNLNNGMFDYNNFNNGMFDYGQFNYNQFAASGFNYSLYGFDTNDYNCFVNQYGMLNTIDEYMYYGIPPMYLPLFFAMLADRQREVVPYTPEQEDKMAFRWLMVAVVIGMIGFVKYMFF